MDIRLGGVVRYIMQGLRILTILDGLNTAVICGSFGILARTLVGITAGILTGAGSGLVKDPEQVDDGNADTKDGQT
jgi:hypothetical protein